MSPPIATLFGLMAAEAPRAILLRRGPSHRVALIAWDTGRDTFEVGQWFKGHIPEDRCDLSPRGERFLFLAERSVHHGYSRVPDREGPVYLSWTAISRPPYLTALALWPGARGGWFVAENAIALLGSDDHLAAGFELPPGFLAAEDTELVARFASSGMVLSAEESDRLVGRWPRRRDPDGSLVKPGVGCSAAFEIRTAGYGRDLRTALVRDETAVEIEGAGWADWDPRTGDLVFSRGHRLFRCPINPDKKLIKIVPMARELIDFGDLVFTELAPPLEATRW